LKDPDGDYEVDLVETFFTHLDLRWVEEYVYGFLVFTPEG